MAFTAALARLDRKIPYSSKVNLSYGSGIGREMLNTGEQMGAGWVFGRLLAEHRNNKWVNGPVPINLSVGLLAKFGAVVGSILSNGNAGWTSHLNAVGNAGLTTWTFSHGVASGHNAAGRRLYVLDKGQTAPAGLNPASTLVGAIPPGQPGMHLNLDEMADLAMNR